MVFLGLGVGVISIYGFFVEPLAREFGVGVAVINLGPVALLLIPGIVSPFIGKLVDRLPIRAIILFGVTLAMAALLLTSRAPTLPLVGAGFTLFVFGAIFYGPVVVNGLMVKLYPGREARALAIAAIGISFAAAVLPPATGVLLANFHWRAALAILAGVLLLILWCVALLGVPGGVVGAVAASDEQGGMGIYREPAFWLIGGCMALGLNTAVVMAVCYPPHFVAEGYSLADAGWFLALSGMAGLFGKLSVAWIGDRVRAHARWLAVGILVALLVGYGLLLQTEGRAQVLAAMVLLGYSGGAFLPMHPFLNSRYFDASIIGQVTGAQMPLFLPLGIVGAPLAGFVFDRTGSYDLVLVGICGILAVAACLALCLPAARD
ncbi:MAG: hypothetical protein CME59_08620 [Halioglobus sp.]|nr:hypothetical protein [Halioglobus sp.]|tara:strand:+ start:84 stop:1214 length:1131 start_codon:yes stop_codon:yes gene_type:complete